MKLIIESEEGNRTLFLNGSNVLSAEINVSASRDYNKRPAPYVVIASLQLNNQTPIELLQLHLSVEPSDIMEERAVSLMQNLTNDLEDLIPTLISETGYSDKVYRIGKKKRDAIQGAAASE